MSLGKESHTFISTAGYKHSSPSHPQPEHHVHDFLEKDLHVNYLWGIAGMHSRPCEIECPYTMSKTLSLQHDPWHGQLDLRIHLKLGH